MRFEPETKPTTCETCRFIASQVDGAVTALDAFEGAVRSRDARIAALEAERGPDSCNSVLRRKAEQARGDAEASRLRMEDQVVYWKERADIGLGELKIANQRIAALEAERDELKRRLEDLA